jgi:hypothetical protein
MKHVFLFLAVCLLPAAAFAQSGTEGGLSWSLSGDTLTVSGAGDMPDYYYYGANVPYFTDTIPWFSYQESIRTVVIEEGVTRIGTEAFYRCANLVSVIIPGSVTSFGKGAFDDPNVSMPPGPDTVGEGIFARCTSLADVTVGWATPLSISAWTFMETSVADATLHVPAGTKALYEAAEVWKDFGTIVEDGGLSVLSAPASYVYYDNGLLTVNTPAGEPITVYSSSGSLLYRAQKGAGEVHFRIGSLPRGVLIVKGDGWVKKIVQ